MLVGDAGVMAIEDSVGAGGGVVEVGVVVGVAGLQANVNKTNAKAKTRGIPCLI